MIILVEIVIKVQGQNLSERFAYLFDMSTKFILKLAFILKSRQLVLQNWKTTHCLNWRLFFVSFDGSGGGGVKKRYNLR